MSNRFTQYILIAMVLGIVMGTIVFNYFPDQRVEIAADVNLIAMLFLRLIKMIIAPLVFATLVGGIAHMGSGARLGRIFAKTMGWFVTASFVSLLLGLVMVNLLQPGANFPGTLPAAGQSTGLPVSAFSIEKFLTHLIPTSIADAMAQNEILQIVVFAVFFAVALGSMPERAKPIIAMIDDLAHIMLKVTGYVMRFAPFAVWAAIMATVSKNGLGVLWKLIQFMGGFYLALAILWGILVIVGFIVIGPRYSHLLRLIREPLMIAFSTASSEAAYPKTLEGLNRFGASSRISAFVLPLGYSFNLDGTMMYCTFASIFIAQTYHIEMSLGTQLAMLATLMITSKGVAGVLSLAACLLATAASAQTGGSEGLSPTLANIKNTHVVRLGYRESSPPFSFLDQANRPIGYSLELCEAVVDEIGVEVDDPNLKIAYVKVTSDDRIPAVVQNKIDLECGSTTANAERAKQVAFSPLMFVAGTKLMVPKASSVAAVTDLKGKTVVVTKGTTNEQAMHSVDKKFALGLNIVAAADHEQSYQMLVDGKADAFATDDILLYGLIARHKSQDKFRVTGDYLSYDPYGIMFRKGEPQLNAVVERAFRKLGSNHDLIPLYNKWFVSRLPTGERLNVAISPQLEEAFHVLDDSPGANN